MKIFPFPAIRPDDNDLACSIASLPYDVINTDEARVLAARNPDSFLRVVRSEIDLPEDTDPYAEIVYQQARAALDALEADGRLVQEKLPLIYLYRQIMGTHAQTAIVACCRIEDYADNTIRKHEKTRSDKEDDRTSHILTTNANTGQVFLTYRDLPAIDRLVESAMLKLPVYEFVSADGVIHTVWRVANSADFVAAFEAVPRAYIADGHHRSAASWRAGSARRAANPQHNGSEEYNRFMACLFPASQLQVLPYNRLLLTLNGRTPGQLLEEIGRIFTVAPTDKDAPEAARSCHMYLDGRWYRLSWEVPADAPVTETLDATVLQERLLAPLLGISDPRTDRKIEFVGGIRGTGELVRKVDVGEACLAFSMYPTSVEDIMRVADAGEIMPPKSTWFEPKLRSGLLIHRLD